VGTAITFVVLIAGSYLVGEGAGPACSSWPGCVEAPAPFLDGGRLQHVHWLHRATVVVGALAVGAVAWSLMWVERAGPSLRRGVGLLAALYAAQVIVGAANIWTDHSAAIRSAHLAIAAAIWALLVTTVVAGRFAPGPAEERATTTRTPAASATTSATTGESARV
jgi:heme A synthase